MLKLFGRKRVNPVFQHGLVFLTATGVLLTTFQVTRTSHPSTEAESVPEPTPLAISTKNWPKHTFEWLTFSYPIGWNASYGMVQNFDICSSDTQGMSGENKSIRVYALPSHLIQTSSNLVEAARSYATYIANNTIVDTKQLLAPVPMVWQRECEGDICFHAAYIEAGNKIYRFFGHNLKDTPEDNVLFSAVLQSLYVKPKDEVTVISAFSQGMPEEQDFSVDFLKIRGRVPPKWQVETTDRFQTDGRYTQAQLLPKEASWFGATTPKSHRKQLLLSTFPGYRSQTTQVCSGQGCAVEGLVLVKAFGKEYTGEVIRAFVNDGCGQPEAFDYYAFVITFEDILVDSSNGSRLPLTATGVFETLEDGRELATMLESLNLQTIEAE